MRQIEAARDDAAQTARSALSLRQIAKLGPDLAHHASPHFYAHGMVLGLT
jgi:hypothetical protein